MYQISMFCVGLLGLVCVAPTQAKAPNTIEQQMQTLEKNSGGRIGLAAIDLSNERQIQYHGDERFPMGCTSKVIGVAAILQRSKNNGLLLDKKIKYTQKDLTEAGWAPVTKKYLQEGMTVRDLCAAAISYSDNTAMNLLVKELGNVGEMNTFARSIGDTFFRQDNGWPREAYSTRDEQTDSTTPLAMEQSLRKILFGKVLPPQNKELLKNWLMKSVTGNERIRAGVPSGWLTGDKTGSGVYFGITNDIAVIWPPHCKPVIITIYYSADKKEDPPREDILASATKIVLNELGKTNLCIEQALRTSSSLMNHEVQHK